MGADAKLIKKTLLISLISFILLIIEYVIVWFFDVQMAPSKTWPFDMLILCSSILILSVTFKSYILSISMPITYIVGFGMGRLLDLMRVSLINITFELTWLIWLIFVTAGGVVSGILEKKKKKS